MVGSPHELSGTSNIPEGRLKSFLQVGMKSLDSSIFKEKITKDQPSTEKNFKPVNEKEIYDIYSDAKKRHNDSKNEDGEKLPNILHKSLVNQEKSLNRTRSQQLLNKLITKNISKKIHRSQSRLMMNRYEEFRKKKEERDTKSLEDTMGMFSWILSLRKSDNPKENVPTYLNVGKAYRPCYQFIKESPSKNDCEIIRNPDKSLDRQAIKIEGKSLIEEELLFVKKMKGKKLLYNDEERRKNKFEIYDQKYDTFQKSFFRKKELKRDMSQLSISQKGR